MYSVVGWQFVVELLNVLDDIPDIILMDFGAFKWRYLINFDVCYMYESEMIYLDFIDFNSCNIGGDGWMVYVREKYQIGS